MTRKSVAKSLLLQQNRNFYILILAMDQLSHLLRAHGYSLTTARTRVFSTLLDSHNPLKRGEIVARTSEINRSSVYRTLELFNDIGITTTTIRGWTPYIELAEPFQAHHHHIICTNCGDTVSIKNDELEKLVGNIATRHNFSLSHHHIELSGTCSTCLKAN